MTTTDYGEVEFFTAMLDILSAREFSTIFGFGGSDATGYEVNSKLKRKSTNPYTQQSIVKPTYPTAPALK